MSINDTNPYVGLRPFDVDESLLFFGRKEQTLELLQRLHQHHFVAVMGSSGCGKSSLLRAGLISALKAGYLVDDSDHWLVCIMKPGQSPLYNLAESLLQQVNPESTPTEVESLVQKMMEEGADPILNIIVPLRKVSNINFFILVDQFEELFRFAFDQNDISKKDEATNFVKIIMELAQQNVVPFYVVITMRADFIGDCAQFIGLPEAMNKSLFLVPRLNRVQLKMVIEGPAKLYGGKLNPSLTSRLLNELDKVKDELPVLQHALMRIWDHEIFKDKNGELDLEDYKSIGGLEKALSIHADEALTGMSMEQKTMTKKLFQALTTIDENGRKIRRPVLFSQLEKLTLGTEGQLLNIIDHFIKDKRSFLTINKAANSKEKVIDISHESLIRQWDTLSNWVDEEGESASMYLHLIEATNLQKQDKKDFLIGSELQLALEWRDKFKPSAIWADLYKKGFEECMAYLKASEDERTHMDNVEKARKKNKRFLVVAVIGLLLIVATGGIYGLHEADKQQKILQSEMKKVLESAKEAQTQKLKADSALIIAENKTKEALIQKRNADLNLKKVIYLSKVATEATTAVADISAVAKELTKTAEDSSAVAKELRISANYLSELNVKLSKASIGTKYQGGIVFYYDKETGKGLLAAEKDFNTKYNWEDAREACEDYSVNVGGIIYDDWRLPTHDELDKLYAMRGIVGGFDFAPYWSSSMSEINNDYFLIIGFGNGSTTNGDRRYSFKVRAVRTF
jgi:energy-coupling factor transporter ATP-binding protein EcfA2